VEETSGYDSDEEEEHFVRNIKRGANKYKGNLPFKIFNCGRIGHYSKKCHFEENKIFHKKKILCSNQDDNYSDESDGEYVREVIFITQETQNDDKKNYEKEEINSEEEYDEGTNFDSFWGGKFI
jgi:hypothetical protein